MYKKEEEKMEEKKYTEKELTEAVRAAIQDRATWFYLLLKAAKEAGVDDDKIAKKAITHYGKLKGKNFNDVKNAGDFVTKLSTGVLKGAFDMERVVAEDNRGELKFKHCALVEAWKKLGCTNKEIEDLCKMANYGDYGMISCFQGLELEFPKMISKGDSYCHMVVTKK